MSWCEWRQPLRVDQRDALKVYKWQVSKSNWTRQTISFSYIIWWRVHMDVEIQQLWSKRWSWGQVCFSWCEGRFWFQTGINILHRFELWEVINLLGFHFSNRNAYSKCPKTMVDKLQICLSILSGTVEEINDQGENPPIFIIDNVSALLSHAWWWRKRNPLFANRNMQRLLETNAFWL